MGFRIVISVFIIHHNIINSRSRGERQNGARCETSFLRLFLKAGRGRSVNGTRACIHAEIMEIDGDDLRGKARRTSGNGGKDGRKGVGRQEFTGDLGWNVGTAIFLRAGTIFPFAF